MRSHDRWQIGNAAFFRYLLSRSDFPYEPHPLPLPVPQTETMGQPVRPAAEPDGFTKVLLPLTLLGLGILFLFRPR
jgi:hypothetical protein